MGDIDALSKKTDDVMRTLTAMREHAYADPHSYARRINPMAEALMRYLGFSMGWYEPRPDNPDAGVDYVLYLACLPCGIGMQKCYAPEVLAASKLDIPQMQRYMESLAVAEWYITTPQCSHVMAWQNYFEHWHEDTQSLHSILRRRALEQWALEIQTDRMWDESGVDRR